VALNDTLNESVGMLQEMGFFNYALPFGIFFLILYGILDNYKVVSKNNKVNALVSLLISAFIMLYAHFNKIEWFFALFYTKMSIAILILVFALTISVFAHKALSENGVIPKDKDKIWGSALIMLSVLLLNAAFSGIPGEIGTWAADASGIIIGVGFMASVLSFFTNKGSTEEKGK
jgi:hypothetical protein